MKAFFLWYLAIIDFGFRIIWRIMEIEDAEADNTLPDLHNSFNDTKAKINDVLLFIQNNF